MVYSNSDGYADHSLIKLDDPLNGYSGANNPEVISCELKLTVYYRGFEGSQSANIQVERARNFSPTANWNEFSKNLHPEIIYDGGEVVSIPVSLAILGDFDNGYGDYPFSIDLTPLCKKMLQEKKYLLYLSYIINNCPSDTYCASGVDFYGFSSSNIPRMEWKLVCKF